MTAEDERIFDEAIVWVERLRVPPDEATLTAFTQWASRVTHLAQFINLLAAERAYLDHETGLAIGHTNEEVIAMARAALTDSDPGLRGGSET